MIELHKYSSSILNRIWQKIVEKKNPSPAGMLATTPSRGMEGEIKPTAKSESMDARTPRRGMEGDVKPTGSMSSYKKPKTEMGGGSVISEATRHKGIFVADVIGGGLCTKNMVPGVATYNGKIIHIPNEDGTEVEYRVWNPCHSTLAAAIILGMQNTWIKPGARILYLGAGSGATVSHISDILGPNGVVYAVEYSMRFVKELVNMAARRANVIPILEDAGLPEGYTSLVGKKVDVIYCDLAKADQAKILVKNATYYLKDGGHFVMSIRADCKGTRDILCDQGVEALETAGFMPQKEMVLSRIMQNNAVIFGGYKVSLQRNNAS